MFHCRKEYYQSTNRKLSSAAIYHINFFWCLLSAAHLFTQYFLTRPCFARITAKNSYSKALHLLKETAYVFSHMWVKWCKDTQCSREVDCVARGVWTISRGVSLPLRIKKTHSELRLLPTQHPHTLRAAWCICMCNLTLHNSYSWGRKRTRDGNKEGER